MKHAAAVAAIGFTPPRAPIRSPPNGGVFNLSRPDGLRTVGPQTLIQAEGQGRLAELTIKGNHAEVRVLQEGLKAATGVTMVGDTALVLVERARAVPVPYRPQ